MTSNTQRGKRYLCEVSSTTLPLANLDSSFVFRVGVSLGQAVHWVRQKLRYLVLSNEEVVLSNEEVALSGVICFITPRQTSCKIPPRHGAG